MLLTWMAFRGKFPRAEPLHFLDCDFLGVSVVRTEAVPFRAPARTRIAPQRARPVAVPTLGRSGLCVGSTLRSRCDIRERERWAAFPACSQPRSQAFTAACRSQPSFTTACRSQPPVVHNRRSQPPVVHNRLSF